MSRPAPARTCFLPTGVITTPGVWLLSVLGHSATGDPGDLVSLKIPRESKQVVGPRKRPEQPTRAPGSVPRTVVCATPASGQRWVKKDKQPISPSNAAVEYYSKLTASDKQMLVKPFFFFKHQIASGNIALEDLDPVFQEFHRYFEVVETLNSTAGSRRSNGRLCSQLACAHAHLAQIMKKPYAPVEDHSWPSKFLIFGIGKFQSVDSPSSSDSLGPISPLLGERAPKPLPLPFSDPEPVRPHRFPQLPLLIGPPPVFEPEKVPLPRSPVFTGNSCLDSVDLAIRQLDRAKLSVDRAPVCFAAPGNRPLFVPRGNPPQPLPHEIDSSRSSELFYLPCGPKFDEKGRFSSCFYQPENVAREDVRVPFDTEEPVVFESRFMLAIFFALGLLRSFALDFLAVIAAFREAFRQVGYPGLRPPKVAFRFPITRFYRVFAVCFLLTCLNFFLLGEGASPPPRDFELPPVPTHTVTPVRSSTASATPSLTSASTPTVSPEPVVILEVPTLPFFEWVFAQFGWYSLIPVAFLVLAALALVSWLVWRCWHPVWGRWFNPIPLEPLIKEGLPQPDVELVELSEYNQVGIDLLLSLPDGRGYYKLQPIPHSLSNGYIHKVFAMPNQAGARMMWKVWDDIVPLFLAGASGNDPDKVISAAVRVHATALTEMCRHVPQRAVQEFFACLGAEFLQTRINVGLASVPLNSPAAAEGLFAVKCMIAGVRSPRRSWLRRILTLTILWDIVGAFYMPVVYWIMPACRLSTAWRCLRDASVLPDIFRLHFTSYDGFSAEADRKADSVVQSGFALQ